MRTPKRCLKYDSTRNFYYQIDNIIMPDRKYFFSFVYLCIYLFSFCTLLIHVTINNFSDLNSHFNSGYNFLLNLIFTLHYVRFA